MRSDLYSTFNDLKSQLIIPSLKARRLTPELMDDPNVDPEELRKALRFIRRINRWLGYTKATMSYIERFSVRWKPGELIHFVDFATGSADVPLAILEWADQKGWNVRVTGIDFHERTAQEAIRSSSDPRLTIVCADALNPPFAPDSFDYALTSLFLHHLPTNEATQVLANMARVARRGIIAGDLLRNWRAYAGIKLLSSLANPIVRHDAPASVAAGFVREEVLAMRKAAGVEFARYRAHIAHRFVLAGEK